MAKIAFSDSEKFDVENHFCICPLQGGNMINMRPAKTFIKHLQIPLSLEKLCFKWKKGQLKFRDFPENMKSAVNLAKKQPPPWLAAASLLRTQQIPP